MYLSSPVRRWQDVSVGVPCEDQLPSHSFHHQALKNVEQEMLVCVSWHVYSLWCALGLGPLSQTFCSTLSVHRAVLFPLPSHCPTGRTLRLGLGLRRRCRGGRRVEGWSSGAAKGAGLSRPVDDGLRWGRIQ